MLERPDPGTSRAAARATQVTIPGAAEAHDDRTSPRRRSPRGSLLTREVWAGLVVALALIPESMSFAVVAGVRPEIGLMTSVVLAIGAAVVGGRPAMVSGAAGSVALVTAPLVREHGMRYLVAAVIVGGVLQVVLSLCGVARLMRFVPRAVTTGFVNALAILILLAQIPQLVHVPVTVYLLVGCGLILTPLCSRLVTTVPAPLVVTALLTVLAATVHPSVPRIGGAGGLGAPLMHVGIPTVPATVGTVLTILPYSCALALVGLMESFLTAGLVDEITATDSNMRREGCGQGVANILAGAVGGMGGCAMIGQTMINVKGSGARTRLSPVVAGLALLAAALWGRHLLAMIPMAALVVVMATVSLTTMDWRSLSPSALRNAPPATTAVMAVTMIVTVATQNLAYGVVGGLAAATVLGKAERVWRRRSAGPGPSGQRAVCERVGYREKADAAATASATDDPFE
ncbi:SulP family inorganic anion transporter [Tsukamurella soli]|uniref:SLC26A/SulP transporter domain-containing protein n=1 Tax=Tsukamurella soli TaxID=644556 RepID=A0ABP8JAG9_9ACTN